MGEINQSSGQFQEWCPQSPRYCIRTECGVISGIVQRTAVSYLGTIVSIWDLYICFSAFVLASPFSGRDGTLGRSLLAVVTTAAAIWDVLTVSGLTVFATPLVMDPCRFPASVLTISVPLLSGPLWLTISVLANDEHCVSVIETEQHCQFPIVLCMEQIIHHKIEVYKLNKCTLCQFTESNLLQHSTIRNLHLA